MAVVAYGGGEPTGWLSASLSSTSTPSTLTISANIGGLDAGTYNATVTVTTVDAPDRPVAVAVTLTLEPPPPTLALPSEPLVFTAELGGTDPTAQVVTVANSGTGVLLNISLGAVRYASGEPTGWLPSPQLSGTSGTPTLTLRPKTGGLGVGSYHAQVTVISANAVNSPASLAVVFDVVAPVPAGLSISTQPAGAKYGAAFATQPVVRLVGASGQAAAVADVEVTAQLEAGTGVLTPDSTVTFLTDTLGVAVFDGLGIVGGGPHNLRFTAENLVPVVSQEFDVAYLQVIALDSTSIRFASWEGGPDPAPVRVGVVDGSGAGLTDLSVGGVSYADGQPTGWLVDATLEGAAAPTTLTLAVSADGLAPGAYVAGVTLLAPAAAARFVEVTFEVEEGPSIAVSDTTIAFVATAGGGSAAPDTVTITNAGGGVLAGVAVAGVVYGAGEPTGWLDVVPDGQTAPVSIQVTATTGALTPGLYTATIEIGASAAANTPVPINVSFDVRGPQIVITDPSPAVFVGSLGGNVAPSSRAVTISNGGSGELSGLALGDVSYGPGAQGWLDPLMLSGSMAPASVTVSIATGSLPPDLAEGVYTAVVPVTSTSYGVAPGLIQVELTLTAVEQICLGEAEVAFRSFVGGTDPAPDTVTAVGCAGGQVSVALEGITYVANQPSDWLSAVVGLDGEIELAATLGSLSVGSYSAIVRLSSADPNVLPVELPVRFDVDGAQQEIGADPPGVELEGVAGAPDPEPVTSMVINASGLGVLSGLSVAGISYAQAGNGWLLAELEGATAPATLTLTPTVAGLSAGIFGAEVLIASEIPGVDTLHYPVTLRLLDPPSIVVAPGQLSFVATEYRDNPPPQLVQVTNGGDLPLTGMSIAAITAPGGGPADWLGASLDAPDAPSGLTVLVDIAGLSPGTYQASITVASDRGGVTPVEVAVELVVSPGEPPSIALTDQSAFFEAAEGGAEPPPRVIGVENGGDVPLSGLYLEPIAYGPGATGWATALLFGTTAPSIAAIYASQAGLDPGTYWATITMGSTLPGVAPRAIPVTLSVMPPPVLMASSSSASFSAGQGGSDPAPVPLSVTSSGIADGLTATVFDGEPTTPWLTASIGATTPATLTLEADVSGLDEGFYTGSVRVSSTTAGVNPIYINASLVVGQPMQPRAVVLSPAVMSVATNWTTTPADQYTTVLSGDGSTVRNLFVGSATLDGEPASWVRAYLSADTTPATLTVDFLSLAAPVGTSMISIPVGSYEPDVTSTNVTIDLSVDGGSGSAPGLLAVSRTELSFKGHTNGLGDGLQNVQVTNAGGGTVYDIQRLIQWKSGGVGWLGTFMTNNIAPTDFLVSVDYPKLSLSPGLYTATLTVRGQRTSVPSGGSNYTEATIDVEVFVSDAAISVDQTDVDIQPYPIVGSTTPVEHYEPVRITNLGLVGPLTGLTVTNTGGAAWLTPVLSSSSAPALLRLRGDPTGLSIGRYTETVSIGFDQNPDAAQVDVSLRVFGFELAASAVSMSAQDGYAPDVAVRVSYEGNAPEIGSIVYAEGEPGGWLSAQPTCPFSGCPSNQFDITLRAEPDDLVPGVYSADLMVDGSNPGVPSQAITVTLTVAPPTIPVLALSTHEATFAVPAVGASPPPLDVEVTNTGTGTITDLNLGGSTIPSWLTATFDGTTAPTILRLAADVAGLLPGSYFTTLYVGGDGAGEFPQIAVALNVPVAPQIALSTSLLEFNAEGGAGNPSSKTTRITATGSGVPAPLTDLAVDSISYPPAQSTGWVSYALSSTTAPATLRIQPITGGLAEGIHEATVWLSSPVAANSPRALGIRFDVGPPDLAVATNTVALTGYSSQPQVAEVAVTSGGAVVDDLVLSQPAYQGATGWLTAELTGGNATPSKIRLTASIGSLPAGTYEASVDVASAMSDNSPQTITVTFEVLPGIGIGQSFVAFPLGSPPQGSSTLSQTVAITNVGAGTLTGLSASVSSGSSWLQATLDQTTAPATLTLSVSAGSLPPGLRTATVTVASPVAGNSPQAMTVWYTISTSFSADVGPLISGTRCTGCHGGTTTPDLRASPSYSSLRSRLVNQPTPCTTESLTYVVPGRPDLSQLLILVGPRPLSGYPCGRRFMPPTESYSPTNATHTTLRYAIDAWIREGAPNN